MRCDIDLKSFEYKDFVHFHTLVRREFVLRNQEKYAKECYKVGDVVKIKVSTGRFLPSYHGKKYKHDPVGDVLLGVISKAHVQRSGRIQNYVIKVFDGPKEVSISRGIRQVEAATEEESRAAKLLHAVRTIK